MILLMMYVLRVNIYIKGQKNINENVNTFKTSDKQAINMIAGALHVLKALTQSMHLLKTTISVLFPIE